MPRLKNNVKKERIWIKLGKIRRITIYNETVKLNADCCK